MRRAPCPAPLLALLAGLAALALPVRSFGVGAEERQVAMTGGAGRLAGGPGGWGGLGRVEGQYGVSDTLALHLTLGVSWHGTDPAVRAVAAVAGVTYAIDVLRVVPFFEGGVAFLAQEGAASAPRADLGLEVGVGGEYLLDRYWALALVARVSYLPLRPSGLQGTPSLLSLGVRLGRTF
jgi:hypothetical protein